MLVKAVLLRTELQKKPNTMGGMRAQLKNTHMEPTVVVSTGKLMLIKAVLSLNAIMSLAQLQIKIKMN
jgi:hypothetical protein